MIETAQDTVVTVTKAITTADHQFTWFFLENSLINYIAVAIGFFIIFISYFFGGVKQNQLRMVLCIIIGFIVGILTLPLLLNLAGQDNPGLAAFFIGLDIIFSVTVACHLYELTVVSAREAFNPNLK